MAKKQRDSVSLPQLSSTIVTGGIVSFAVCVLCMALTAWLIFTGHLAETAMLRAWWLSALLGCFAGGLYASHSSQCKMLLSALSSSLIHLLIWLILATVLYHGIHFPSAGICLTASTAGGAAAGLLSAGLR